MTKHFTFLLSVCLILITSTQAQTWKWAKRMGGIAGDRYVKALTGSSFFAQKAVDLAADPKGNVYLLSHDLDSSVDVDGHPLTAYGRQDVFISSFTCDGVLRWSKVIGTNLDTDFCMSIRTDAVGGVYVCGTMTLLSSASSTGGHLGADTVIGNTPKTIFIAKWDTAGIFKWLRMPQPDTISYTNSAIHSSLMDMDVDAEGTSYTLAYLTPGAYAGGNYIVPARGTYVLKYNVTGQFTGAVPIPISISSNFPSDLQQTNYLTYSAALSRFFIVGRGGFFNIPGHSGTVTIGTAPLSRNEGYIGSFNATTGALIWLKASNSPVGNSPVWIEDRAKLDDRNNIYITGSSSDSAVFNGIMFSNPQQSHVTSPFVMKMDAATGNPLWAVSAKNARDARSYALAVSNNKVLVGGTFSGKVVFPTDSFSNVYTVDSVDCFMLQMDAGTGAIQKRTQLSGPGLLDKINRIVTDRKGNFYYAGRFGSSLPISKLSLSIGSNVLASAGATDAFVSKWGFNNCNCVLPAPAFTAATPNNKTVQYTYTGTTASIDSLIWDWGDGQRQKVSGSYTTPLSHTYATNGKYNVCVTAYRDTCGYNTYCSQTPLSVGEAVGLRFTVSPNPTDGHLHIGVEEGGTVTVLNLLGQTLMSKNRPSGGRYDLDIQCLPAGNYILHIRLQDGRSGYARIAKQ